MHPIWKRGGRLRFAFSLRAMLCATGLICFWLGWQVHVVEDRRALREWLDWREASVSVELFEVSEPPFEAKLPWYRRLLGDDHVKIVILEPDVPLVDKLRVERAFPEASVRQTGTTLRRLTDEQFAPIKRQRLARRSFDAKLKSVFISGVEPADGDLFVLTPQIENDVIRSCDASYDEDSLPLTSAIRALHTMAKLLALQAQLPDRPEGAPAIAAELTDQSNLRAVLRREASYETPQQYGEHLIDCLQALHAARVARAEGKVDEQRRAASQAANVAEEFYALARSAYRPGFTRLDDLLLPVELLRDAQLALPMTGQAEADLAERAAWTRYQQELELWLGKIQAEPGAGAEKLYFVTARLATTKAELARIAGDAVGQESALAVAVAESELAVDAHRNAWLSRRATFEQVLYAIEYCGDVKRAQAEQRGDKALQLAALEERTESLFDVIALHCAHKRWCVETISSIWVKIASCHYLLARFELMDAQADR